MFNVLITGLTSLLTDISTEMVYPLLPLYLSTALGASPAIVGIIEGLAEGFAPETVILLYLVYNLVYSLVSLPRRSPVGPHRPADVAGPRLPGLWPGISKFCGGPEPVGYVVALCHIRPLYRFYRRCRKGSGGGYRASGAEGNPYRPPRHRSGHRPSAGFHPGWLFVGYLRSPGALLLRRRSRYAGLLGHVVDLATGYNGLSTQVRRFLKNAL